MIETVVYFILYCQTRKNFRLVFSLFLVFAFVSLSSAQNNTNPKIEGTLQLDSIWNPKVYLSHISDFSKMYTMSKSMIIAESDVDSSGYFKFNIDFLPKEDNLYRIHVAKKGASEVSLIIGGKSENHFFLVANNTSSIKIWSESKIFNDVRFLTDSKNKIIEKVDAVVRFIDSSNYNATRVKSEFVTNAFNEQLRQIADTCAYPLVALYALKKSNYETNISNNTVYYQNLKEKWTNENSIYFKNFKSKIPNKKNNSSNTTLIVIGFIVSFLLGFTINKGIKRTSKKASKTLKSLSIQERKILTLLKEGKSNKDISEELHIGLSTVKSHASNIYAKLGIKSRKEILDLKL